VHGLPVLPGQWDQRKQDCACRTRLWWQRPSMLSMPLRQSCPGSRARCCNLAASSAPLTYHPSALAWW